VAGNSTTIQGCGIEPIPVRHYRVKLHERRRKRSDRSRRDIFTTSARMRPFLIYRSYEDGSRVRLP
jgi:hypothetical protein